MAIKQISVFVENKKGSLLGITEALAENGIDMNALTLADTADFGIMRMIVTDTDKAKEVLSAAALTYLASLLTSLVYFLRFLLYVLTIFGRRD